MSGLPFSWLNKINAKIICRRNECVPEFALALDFHFGINGSQMLFDSRDADEEGGRYLIVGIAAQ